jgi:hypothetical protein
MRDVRPNQIPWRSPNPLVGLLLVVLFLGHDTLMAAEALAMPRHAARMEAGDHHPLAVEGLPPAEHPDTCGIGQSAAVPTGQTLLLALTPKVGMSFTTPLLPAACATSNLVWEEPHWPPGRLRSLIQVYRM